MFFARMWKRRSPMFADRRLLARKTRQRSALLLEPLEDRMLLTAWTAIGPAPLLDGQTAGLMSVSGRITGLAADPNNANIVFAATAGGGIWESINAETSNPTWSPLTDNLTDSNGNPLPMFMGAIAETDATSGPHSGNQIVYGGMGEANDSADSFYGEGILVSTNGGQNWTLTNANGAFTGRTVSKIAIDPTDPTGGTAYAAVCGNGSNGNTGNTGIWKTTDFGQTWTNMTAAAPNNLSTTDAWTDVVVDPQTGNVYAAQGAFLGANGNGVYESTNGGTNWNLLNGTGSYNGKQDGRIALALYDDGTTNELFVYIAQPNNAGDTYQLLESTDGGSTFSNLTSNSKLLQNLTTQGGYDITMAVDPQDPSYVYISACMANQGPTYTGSPLESFDGGATWTDIATDSAKKGPHSDAHAAVFDKDGNLLDGNDGGIFRLDNPTNSSTQLWTDLNTNLQITQFEGVAVDTTNGDTWGGAQDNGTEKYSGTPSSGDLAWTEIPVEEGDGGYTRVDPTNHDIVYQEYTSVALRVTLDGGSNFHEISSGIKYNNSGGSPNVQFYAPYVLDSSGNVYYGTDYLNLSTDHGKTWTQIATPGSNSFNADDYAINSIAVASNNNIVYVATGGAMFVTQNAQAGGNSVTWTRIDLPGDAIAGNNYADSIAIDPADTTGHTAYAVVNAFGASRVFMTTTMGSSWTDITGNLPDYPVDSVVVSPDGSTVYAGIDVGVYSTTNSGTTWTPLGSGLPNVQVADMELVPSENLLVIGTHGRGAWEFSTATAPVVTTNPSNQTVTAGQNATFTAAASGTPAPTVQWQISSNGGSTWTNISGATSTTLTLNSVTSSMNGYEYLAVFTNSAGNVNTSAATLTVDFAPVVTTNPSNQTVSAGQNATFSAAANANPAATVQWQVSTDGGKTFTNISGATSTTLTLTSVTFSMNGNEYEAVFTNGIGSPATTSAAILTVDFAPVVTINPTNQRVIAGQTATFTAAANGNPAPTVQWQVSTNGGSSWTDISGATSTTLTLTNVTSFMNGNEYQAVFSNGVGNPATTSFATLTVEFAPVVTTNPSNQTVMAGQNATFLSAANANPAATVQWQVSTNGGATWHNISDATSATLTLTNVTASMNGNEYQAVFTNSVGSAISSAATLSVQALPPPPPPPAPSPPPALNVPPFLALFNSLLGGVVTVNANGSQTITDSLFGIPLLVATFDSSGNLVSASLFGIGIPNWIWSL